jgi:hypothetical protein
LNSHQKPKPADMKKTDNNTKLNLSETAKYIYVVAGKIKFVPMSGAYKFMSPYN